MPRQFNVIFSCAVLFATLDATAAKRPNVLFLLTDDQRPDTIAALGNPHIKTPHLDALVRARNGVHTRDRLRQSDLHAQPRRDPVRSAADSAAACSTLADGFRSGS